MNESAVRRALKTLILENEDILVSGLTFQGNPRNIHQVTTSSITPPTGYYFVSISTTTDNALNRRNFGRTVSVPPSEARYDVLIELADYAIGDPSEDQLFEKMDTDFQLFSDRLISILRKSRWIIDEETASQFVLDGERRVSKNNTGTNWEEAAQYHAMLYCRITFQLLEECTDDSKLY
jgi:hypothetical protein